MENDTHSGEAEQDWRFEPNDVVREKYAKPSPVPGESEAPKAEYRIKRRLVNPDNGEQFYHIEKEEGGTHVYSAGVMSQYERIDVSQSRAWSEETELTRDVGADPGQEVNDGE